MKCPCGYETISHREAVKMEMETDPTGNEPLIDFRETSEPFIEVEMMAIVETEERSRGKYDRRAQVFACPKCGTLRIDLGAERDFWNRKDEE